MGAKVSVLVCNIWLVICPRPPPQGEPMVVRVRLVYYLCALRRLRRMRMKFARGNEMGCHEISCE